MFRNISAAFDPIEHPACFNEEDNESVRFWHVKIIWVDVACERYTPIQLSIDRQNSISKEHWELRCSVFVIFKHKLVDYRCDSKYNVPNPFCYACKYLQTLFDFEKRVDLQRLQRMNNAKRKKRFFKKEHQTLNVTINLRIFVGPNKRL